MTITHGFTTVKPPVRGCYYSILNPLPVNSGAWPIVPIWDDEVYDTDGLYTGGGLFSIPSSTWFRVGIQISFQSNAILRRAMFVFKDIVQTLRLIEVQVKATNGIDTCMQGLRGPWMEPSIIPIQTVVYQDSGVPLNVLAGRGNSYIYIELL